MVSLNHFPHMDQNWQNHLRNFPFWHSDIALAQPHQHPLLLLPATAKSQAACEQHLTKNRNSLPAPLGIYNPSPSLLLGPLPSTGAPRSLKEAQQLSFRDQVTSEYLVRLRNLGASQEAKPDGSVSVGGSDCEGSSGRDPFEVPMSDASLNTDTVYLKLQMCFRSWGRVYRRDCPRMQAVRTLKRCQGNKPCHVRECPA